jgi:hypothetical protein
MVAALHSTVNKLLPGPPIRPNIKSGLFPAGNTALLRSLRDRPKHVSTIVENFTSAEGVGGN